MTNPTHIYTNRKIHQAKSILNTNTCVTTFFDFLELKIQKVKNVKEYTFGDLQFQ